MKVISIVVITYLILAMFAFDYLYFYFVIDAKFYDENSTKKGLFFGVDFIRFSIVELIKMRSSEYNQIQKYAESEFERIYIIKKTKYLVILFFFCYPIYALNRTITKIIDMIFFKEK